ncbi:MAG: ubiquitin carboxyl-terminal hydrolase [Gammaproteobacteria bacterium]|nr:ubiquitin carboxyl-terminal hydrolase [Pseudoalteromonas sp.]MCP4061766.1 ubiquitin carboxyl-terminal hydrolase [Gammaproteobacteria bacterium]MCP4062649.1 ubiquitin carboxyl-terminal hydrolase [Gammaproteobacteria bacterium]
MAAAVEYAYGTGKDGHYVCWIRDQEQRWRRVDDKSLEEKVRKTFVRGLKNVTILFFVRL